MFNDRMKDIRKWRGMTQKDIATALHVAMGTVGNWEAGNRLPDHTMLVKLADILGTSADYLLGRTDDTQAAQPTQKRRDENTFGERLRQLREENGYSMNDLITIYNKRFDGKINKSTLSRYENGLQRPSYTVVVNLAKLFGVSTDFLTVGSTLPERIRAIRTEQGMSQEELAKALGYEGRSAISKVENGERQIKQSMVKEYADALGVTPEHLAGYDSVQKQEPPEPEPKNAFAVIDHQLDTFLQETEEYHNYLKQATKLMTGAVNAAHALKHYLKKLEAFEKDRY